jgi:hypothetical protein
MKSKDLSLAIARLQGFLRESGVAPAGGATPAEVALAEQRIGFQIPHVRVPEILTPSVPEILPTPA